ncbi:MAG: sodium:proton antiporter, partial [Gemmatimonadales bacterium]
LLAAILAPTDAALGQSVVSHPRVPARIRQALNVESGLNDGIALPVVLMLAAVASNIGGGTEGTAHWVRFAVLQVTLGPLVGVAIGVGGAWLIDRSVANGWITTSFEGLSMLGIAFLGFALAELVGGNGFIAAFVGGMVFGNTVRHRCEFLFEFGEAEGQLLALATFLVFGAAMLPLTVGHLGWPVMGYAIASLTIVRMLPVALSLTGARLSWRTHLFLGWFGPRGLASILFALLILEQAEIPHREELLVVTIITVALSALAHGATAAPMANRYAAIVASRGECPEAMPVSEMPTRHGMPSVPGGH